MMSLSSLLFLNFYQTGLSQNVVNIYRVICITFMLTVRSLQKHDLLVEISKPKGRSFVPSLISSQSTIVYVKTDFIDFLEMSLGQMGVPWSQRDIGQKY